MKKPTHAILLLGKNCRLPIDNIHFETQQVTLKENTKVFNTVEIKNVEFDFSNFTDVEIREFKKAFEI